MKINLCLPFCKEEKKDTNSIESWFVYLVSVITSKGNRTEKR